MDTLETHNSSLCALKPRSQSLEQKSMKEKFVIKIEHLSVVFKTICMKLKYFRDSNKYNLNNMHIHLCLYTCILSSDNFEQLLFYNFKQTIQKN